MAPADQALARMQRTLYVPTSYCAQIIQAASRLHCKYFHCSPKSPLQDMQDQIVELEAEVHDLESQLD